MKHLLLLLCVLLASATVSAQHQHPGKPAPAENDGTHGEHEVRGQRPAEEEDSAAHASHDVQGPGNEPAAAPPPPAALSGPRNAADTLFDPVEMAEARRQLRAEEGAAIHSFLLVDRLEAAFGDGDEAYNWDGQGWYGGDLHKLWLKSEGEYEEGSLQSAEIQALYSRAVTAFFDAQFGIRQDWRPEPERSYLVAGLHGLLPYVFELDAQLFLSDEGDLSGRLETEYDLQVTQRLVLQPRVEVEFAAQAVPELRTGSGLTSIEAGLRLRYEIRREFAPYFGIAWERKTGGTADFVRASGQDPDTVAAILGARFWF